ncbi:MAG: DUF177 domain-containing protein [Propionibacteriaceae bacterium]|jgi:uncharacterized protein|nr:DUF177 domain-containing protein [Propionibacteriaceae bacterium]
MAKTRGPAVGALAVDGRDLPRGPGEAKPLRRTAAASDGLTVGLVGVAPGSLIELDALLEAVGEGVLASGRATAVVAGQCARCLSPIARPLTVAFQELFVYPGQAAGDAEVSRVGGRGIDLEPVVRDALLLDLPLAPLCGDDCLGLCAECGANLNDDPSHDHGLTVDDRWAGLAGWVASQAVRETPE